MNLIEFQTELKPKQQDIDEITDLMFAFNSKHRETMERRPIAVFVKDDDGNKIGGITAEIYGIWLEVIYVWVEEVYRKQKIGAKMLNQIEKAAYQQGAQYAYLDTFDYQARGFYLKQGYEPIYTLEPYPITGKKHFFIKTLKKD